AIRQTPMAIVGGTLAANTTWTPAMGMILVVADVIVPTNITLTVQAGSIIKLTNTVALHAAAGGVINVAGAEDSPVLITTAFGTNNWNELVADGANSFLTIRHAEITRGAVKFRNGATGLMEDCYLHDYKNGTVPIAGCTDAASVTVRRCHFSVYHETLWQFTLMLIEDSLFENANNPSSDALDFDGAPPGSVIRRCTFRHGPQGNTDAVDIGSSTIGVLIHDCLMYDFPNDKGVTIGDAGAFSYGIVISNCLIYGCDSAFGVKDTCTAGIFNCTAANNDYGFHNYNKANAAATTGGGIITNSYNNILWGNRTNVALFNGGVAVASYTDVGPTNAYGATNFVTSNNISADPLFLNAALRDYRLATNSPAIGAGLGGATLGAHFPVGAPMAPSHPSFLSITTSNGSAALRFWADSEKTYSVLASDVLIGPYLKIADVASPPVPRLTTVTNSTLSNARYYLLVTPMQ
ncbi:MAG TPA: hypothetical protein VGK40_08715, partial [Verrucomicrobiae bacterium]